jgi:glutamate--cysteine ligase
MTIINTIAKKIHQNKSAIDDFFIQKFKANPAFFYNSIDLRHSSYKISAIDTNCYPAGFNNLSESGKNTAENLVKKFLSNNFLSSPKNIFIIPENHTRNMRYLENLAIIVEILQRQNCQVFIATYNPEIILKTVLTLENQSTITLYPLQKVSGKLAIIDDNKQNIFADLAILNNDLTNGVPEILNNVSTPISPPLAMGWHQRTKSQHFTIYNQTADEVAKILNLDPWLISSMHEHCEDVDFKESIGLECLAKNVENLLKKISEKYLEYNIKDEPYCYIKADNGTYGMAVWSVSNPQDVIDINKKERNKMNMLKGSTQTSKVMIQEGIITADKINNNPCEPMIYMINGEVAQNLFRTNDSRDERISLNASGASFYNLENLPPKNNFANSENNFIIVYELIAKMASLSSSIELNFLKNS